MSNSIKTILFPTDFSYRANRALGEVVAFAEKLNAHIVVCHFYFRPVPDNSLYIDVDNKLLRERERRIDQEFKLLQDFFPALSSNHVKFVKIFGSLTENINEQIQKYKADMIAMATKGAKGFDEFFGSKTSRVAHIVNVPVLALPDNTTLKNISHFGLATDYHEDTDMKSVMKLKDLVSDTKSKLTIVSVNKSADHQLSTNSEKLAKLLHKSLSPLAHEFDYTVHKDIAHGVIEFCKEKSIDIVCVIPSKRSFLEEMFHESVTRRLTHLVPLPLLILK